MLNAESMVMKPHSLKVNFTEQNNIKYLEIDLKKGSVNAQNIKVNKIPNVDLASIQTKMLSSRADLFDDELKSNCCLACTEAFVFPAPAASEFFMTYCGFNICFNKTLPL